MELTEDTTHKCMCNILDSHSIEEPIKYDIMSQKYVPDDRALKAFEKEKDGTWEDFLIGTAGTFSEKWETIFFPSDYHCGETITVFDDMCISHEHWSNREDGQHDVPSILCHFCVLDRKNNQYHIVENSKVEWSNFKPTPFKDKYKKWDEKLLKTETVESVEKLLHGAQIEYKIEKGVVTLTSKAIPRLDGKGYKRRYVYQYIIGKGKWHSAHSNGTYQDTWYRARDIESFLRKYFIDEVDLSGCLGQWADYEASKQGETQ